MLAAAAKLAAGAAVAYAILSGTAGRPALRHPVGNAAVNVVSMTRQDKARMSAMHENVRKELDLPEGERGISAVSYWLNVCLYYGNAALGRRSTLNRWLEHEPYDGEAPVTMRWHPGTTVAPLAAATRLFTEVAYCLADPTVPMETGAEIVDRQAGKTTFIFSKNTLFEAAYSEFLGVERNMALLNGFLFRPWSLRRQVLDSLFGSGDASVYDFLATSAILVQFRPALAQNVLPAVYNVERELTSLHAHQFARAMRALLAIYVDMGEQQHKKTVAQRAQRAFDRCLALYPEDDASRQQGKQDCTYFKQGVVRLLDRRAPAWAREPRSD